MALDVQAFWPKGPGFRHEAQCKKVIRVGLVDLSSRLPHCFWVRSLRILVRTRTVTYTHKHSNLQASRQASVLASMQASNQASKKASKKNKHSTCPGGSGVRTKNHCIDLGWTKGMQSEARDFLARASTLLPPCSYPYLKISSSCSWTSRLLTSKPYLPPTSAERQRRRPKDFCLFGGASSWGVLHFRLHQVW